MTEQKNVFITGASRGIGHATAQYFVNQGWRAITCSRETVPANCPRDERHAHITADLSETDRLSEAVSQLHHVLDGQPLHALVNNAGYSPKLEGGRRPGCLDADMTMWQKTFAINFFAPVFFSRAVAKSFWPRATAPSSTSPRSPGTGSTPSPARPTAPRRRR